MRDWYRAHLSDVTLIVLLVAFTLSYLHFARLDPVHGVGTVDQQYYLGWGGRIADGHLSGDNPFRTPFYPYVIALIFGLARTRDPLSVQLVQIAAAAASLVLVRRIGSRVFGAAAGMTAAVLLLLYWPWIYYTCEIVTEPTFIFLILLFFDLLSSDHHQPPSPRRLLLAGFVLSMAILDRPNGAVLLLPGIAWIFVRSSKDRWAGAIRIGWLIAGMVPLFAVNAIRNGVNVGRPVPVSDQAGVNFYIGNRPGTSGYSARLPGLRADWLYPELHAFTETQVGQRMQYGEVIAYWRARAADLIASEPAEVAANLWKKSILFVNHYEMGNNRELYQFRRTNPVLRWLPITYPWLLAFGVAGLVFIRRNPDGLLVIVLPLALLAGGVVAFFVCSRYRLPAVPFLALLAGAGLTGIVTGMRNRSFTRPVVALSIAGVAFLMSSREVYGLNPAAFAYEREFTLGVLAVQRGDSNAAIDHFEAVLSAKPSFVEAGINLGNLYRDTGRYDRALEIYRRAEQDGGPGLLPIVLLDEGLLHRRRGDYESAIAVYSRYLELRPDAPDGAAHLTICLLSQGRVAEAKTAFRVGVTSGEGRYLRHLGRSVLASEAGVLRQVVARDATLTPADRENLLRVLFPRTASE